MTEQGNPEPVDPQADRLRWLARGVVLAVGLWFVAALGVMYLARRGREG